MWLFEMMIVVSHKSYLGMMILFTTIVAQVMADCALEYKLVN